VRYGAIAESAVGSTLNLNVSVADCAPAVAVSEMVKVTGRVALTPLKYISAGAPTIATEFPYFAPSLKPGTGNVPSSLFTLQVYATGVPGPPDVLIVTVYGCPDFAGGSSGSVTIARTAEPSQEAPVVALTPEADVQPAE